MTGLPAPRFPGLAGYRELTAGCARLGLRHVADLFATGQLPGRAEADAAGLARFLVVDGFRLAQPGNRWRRLDDVVIEQARARFTARFGAAAGQAGELLELLRAALAADPDIVRHVLLYQLAALAAPARPGGADPRRLLDLGVHSDEVDAVRAMVDSYPRPSRAATAAAEKLADAFAGNRMFRAGELLKQIAPDGVDWRLEHVRDEVGRRLDQARQLIGQADGFADRQEFDQAIPVYLQALAIAADEPRLRDGLVRAAVGVCDARAARGEAPAPASSLGRLQADPVGDGIELVVVRPRRSDGDRLDGDRFEFGWTLLRLADATQRTHTLLEGWGSGVPYVDTAVRFGQEVHYAAVPYHNGLICGAASASSRIRYAPEVAEAVLRYTPQGVRLRWRRPGRAVAVSVQRSSMSEGVASRPERVQVALGGVAADRADDFDVAPGTYQYVVRCGYPAPPDSPDTAIVWSAGLILSAVVKPWPTPVTVLKSEVVAVQPPTLRISWLAPTVGTARVVPWPFGPRKPGSDISELTAELAPGLAGQETEGGQYTSALVRGRSGESLRLTAVSELDGRALAGPSILIQLPQAPANVRVHRPVDAPGAVVSFDWPEPAVLVSIRWEQNGLEYRRTVPRSGYTTQGVHIPVGPSACVVTVEPLGRPDAAQVFTSPVTAALAALPLYRRWLRAARRSVPRVLRLLGRRHEATDSSDSRPR